MSGSHTPGPWIADGGRIREEILPGQGGHLIATINEVSPNEADSRLIAAAPELFEVLRRILSLEEFERGYKEAIDEAEALISRIEGE